MGYRITGTAPVGDPPGEYKAILDRLWALATAVPSDDPAENLDRLNGLWHIEHAALDMFRTAMVIVNEDQRHPGYLRYADIGDLMGKHPSTIEGHVHAGRKLMREAS